MSSHRFPLFLLFLVLFSCQQTNEVAFDKHTLVVASASGSAFFSPLYVVSAYDRSVTDLVYESLYKIDANNNFITMIASSMPLIVGTTYRIEIADDHYFSTGEKVTAYDVAHSYQLLAHPSYRGPYRFYASNIEGYDDYANGINNSLKGITVIDDTHLTFTFKNASIANQMIFLFPIISRSSYSFGDLDHLDRQFSSRGSGAYKIEEYKAGKYILLTSNQFYQQANPDIKTVKIVFTSADNDITMLLDGQVDLVSGVGQPAKVKASASKNYLTHHLYTRAGYNAIFLNTEWGPTRSVKVRQALNYGLNRSFFRASYLGDMAIDLLMPVNPLWTEYDDALINQLNSYHYNSQLANQLLEEDGYLMATDGYRYKNNEPLELTWLTTKISAVSNSLIPIITENYRLLGIKLYVVMLDPATLAAESAKDKAIYNMISQSVFEDSKAYLAYKRFYSLNDKALAQNLSRLNDRDNQVLSNKMATSLTDEEFKKYFDQWMINLNQLSAVIILNGSYYADIYNNRLYHVDTTSSWTWRDQLPYIKIKDNGSDAID